MNTALYTSSQFFLPANSLEIPVGQTWSDIDSTQLNLSENTLPSTNEAQILLQRSLVSDFSAPSINPMEYLLETDTFESTKNIALRFSENIQHEFVLKETFSFLKESCSSYVQNIFSSLDKKTKAKYETKYQIIISQIEYLESLNISYEYFTCSILKNILTQTSITDIYNSLNTQINRLNCTIYSQIQDMQKRCIFLEKIISLRIEWNAPELINYQSIFQEMGFQQKRKSKITKNNQQSQKKYIDFLKNVLLCIFDNAIIMIENEPLSRKSGFSRIQEVPALEHIYKSTNLKDFLQTLFHYYSILQNSNIPLERTESPEPTLGDPRVPRLTAEQKSRLRIIRKAKKRLGKNSQETQSPIVILPQPSKPKISKSKKPKPQALHQARDISLQEIIQTPQPIPQYETTPEILLSLSISQLRQHFADLKSVVIQILSEINLEKEIKGFTYAQRIKLNDLKNDFKNFSKYDHSHTLQITALYFLYKRYGKLSIKSLFTNPSLFFPSHLNDTNFIFEKLLTSIFAFKDSLNEIDPWFDINTKQNNAFVKKCYEYFGNREKKLISLSGFVFEFAIVAQLKKTLGNSLIWNPQFEGLTPDAYNTETETIYEVMFRKQFKIRAEHQDFKSKLFQLIKYRNKILRIHPNVNKMILIVIGEPGCLTQRSRNILLSRINANFEIHIFDGDTLKQMEKLSKRDLRSA